MYGYSFKCSDCDLEFNTGWSHHLAGMLVICKGCGEVMSIRNPKTAWGPTKNPHEFCIMGETGWELSGIYLSPEHTRLGHDPDKYWAGWFQLADVACPTCKETNCLFDDLVEGANCPACRQGHIIKVGECIY